MAELSRPEKHVEILFNPSLSKNQLLEVALLHLNGLPDTYNSLLGRNHLVNLYSEILRLKDLFLIILIINDEIIGVCSFSIGRGWKGRFLISWIKSSINQFRIPAVLKFFSYLKYSNSLSRVLRRESEAHILSLIIKSGFRNQKFGKKLILSAKDYLELHNLKSLTVDCTSSEENVVNFYQSLGFNPIFRSKDTTVLRLSLKGKFEPK